MSKTNKAVRPPCSPPAAGSGWAPICCSDQHGGLSPTPPPPPKHKAPASTASLTVLNRHVEFSPVSAAVLAALGEECSGCSSTDSTVPAMCMFVKPSQPITSTTDRHAEPHFPPLSLLCAQRTRPLTHTHHQHTNPITHTHTPSPPPPTHTFFLVMR